MQGHPAPPAAAPAAQQSSVPFLSVPLRYGGAMPVPGFGTWRCDEALLEEAVLHALRIGYRHLDCAQLYKNEHIVGRAIARAVAEGCIGSRAELFVTGKLAPTQMRAASVAPAIKKSLADLFGTLPPEAAYFDLYITHWPYAVDAACAVSPAPWDMRLGYSADTYLAVWRALEAAVDGGSVRALGCSNMTARKLHALCGAARIQPSNVQVELHPCLAQARLLAFCARRGIVVTGYSPLGSPGRPAVYRAEGDPDVLAAPAVVAAAAKHGRSAAQVVLRWAVQRGSVPLPRSTTLARVAENLAGARGDGGLALDAGDMAALDALDATAGSRGRIMKGDNFAAQGQAWQDVWDEDWAPPDAEDR